MRLSRSIVILLISAVGSLAVGATASADTTVRGETKEGVAVKLIVGEFGNVTTFRIGATLDIDCEHGTLNRKARTYRKFTSDPGEFGGTFRDAYRVGAYRFKERAELRGEAADDFTRWSGIYRVRTKVFKHGNKVDTCRLATTWKAS